eukprot:CAMPEP_0115003356 /NCGR_PEP_ID=MMETSP0216-20121206/18565_1 /TAXON_ID=223996 /ORGANISM="Protocruzia adherens, Strain Boccale" /LENGTH=310 /DNA_ID=CAMNT_0002369151 /DNA_START=50 /DNA_END=982 /DNA_ORIENTATION=+
MSSEKSVQDKKGPHHKQIRFIAGAVAGAVSKTTVAPMERIKILFQTTHRKFTWASYFSEAHRVYQEEGFRAFWRGNQATMTRIVPYSATQFLMFEVYKDFFPKKATDSKVTHAVKNMIPGSLAGVTAMSLTYPIDLARTRLAIQTNKVVYPNFASVFSHILRDEGFTALYRGWCMTVIGIIPYTGLNFAFFYTVKEMMEKKNIKTNAILHFLMGACGNVIAQSVAYPCDVIRKKLQAENFYKIEGAADRSAVNLATKTGTFEMIGRVMRNEGVRGFYKGIFVNFIKGPIASGITFSTVEMVTRFLKNYYY